MIEWSLAVRLIKIKRRICSVPSSAKRNKRNNEQCRFRSPNLIKGLVSIHLFWTDMVFMLLSL